MSALIFMGGLWAVYGRFWQEQLLPQSNHPTGALYADLAKALFARFYAKLLISQVGT